MNELKAIAENLRTQDNRCTANPVFCVQGLERIGPLIVGHGTGDLAFYDRDDMESIYHDGPDPKRWELLESQHDDDDLPDHILPFSYMEKWFTVQTCFTEAGCQRYLDQDGHNVRRQYHEVRIYADSFNRNLEMLEVREHILNHTDVIKVAHWALSDDTGLSSEYIAKVFLNKTLPITVVTPSDADDLGRCVRLIETIPNIRDIFPLLRKAIPVWATYLAHWEELTTLWEKGKYKATNLRMQELRKQAWRK